MRKLWSGSHLVSLPFFLNLILKSLWEGEGELKVFLQLDFDELFLNITLTFFLVNRFFLLPEDDDDRQLDLVTNFSDAPSS